MTFRARIVRGEYSDRLSDLYFRCRLYDQASTSEQRTKFFRQVENCVTTILHDFPYYRGLSRGSRQWICLCLVSVDIAMMNQTRSRGRWISRWSKVSERLQETLQALEKVEFTALRKIPCLSWSG